MTDGYEYGGGDGGEDFDEEDVWAVMERNDGSPNATMVKETIFSTPRRFSSASRMMIPKSNGYTEGGGGRVFQQSAPMNIPDWPKIYKKGASGFHGWHRGSNGFSDEIAGHAVTSYYDEEDDEDEDRIPPHEWIAKKLARSQISSFSVFEGKGRTLKGRDLSKVRNAVLTRTGFLE